MKHLSMQIIYMQASLSSLKAHDTVSYSCYKWEISSLYKQLHFMPFPVCVSGSQNTLQGLE